MTKPKVVIIGAGFGGLEAARALRKADAEITVIDRHNHHTFQPLLYQVATATISPADIAWPVRSILRRQENASVMLGTVRAIDPKARIVEADTISLPYDYLVIATGVTHSYFGHDDWQNSAPGLKTLTDATKIRSRVLLSFERAELAQNEDDRKRLLTFVIVGGGPTGVEMAGAIAEIARQTLRFDFRHIDPRAARILLIEAGPRILPAFPEDLSAYAEKSLRKMGVEVMTSTVVTDVERDHVMLGERRIDSEAIIWAAGVKASAAANWLDAEADRAGRIKVGGDLSVPGHPEIFAVGDTATLATPIPGIAPAAKQMGKYAGQVIAARIAGSAPPPPFVYRHAGDLATIGRKSAVVKLNKLKLTGFTGWLFWSVAHIYFLIGIRNRLMVAMTWLWNYLTYQRGARLITRDDRPG
ncbi:MAG: NAD(P)/FAD-dependent oxidoreductase [Xanthobacteraceae bacterium]|nr:NAD(P)/FAD-dependent oxidoreductase [Xanthobacteraceae bacterium]MBX3548613.1 NAD(P)/FAD-dependent oxidoreductase [Xanthobacteraceae bacterium]MCW5673836.1 NAD(P)/FAD-dependent oxidoreductase [Xanthobacteraceae bacterium]